MTALRQFEEMEVWKQARKLHQEIHRVSGKASFSRDYALRDQIRRSAISVASNIAEGFESQSNPSFIRFLACSRGSTAEVRAQLYLALDAGLICQSEFEPLYALSVSISRQISGLIKYLRASSNCKK